MIYRFGKIAGESRGRGFWAVHRWHMSNGDEDQMAWLFSAPLT